MSNPNNCATCGHKQHADGGHCYMFKLEPSGPCVHHTFHVEQWRAMRAERAATIIAALREKGELR